MKGVRLSAIAAAVTIVAKGMSLFYARALRSLRLGMGAKKRASTFDVRAVARIASTVRSVASTAPCVKRGPIAPLNSLIAATCFALREVELSSSGFGTSS